MFGVLSVVMIFHGETAPTIRKSQPEPGNSKKKCLPPHQTTKRFAPIRSTPKKQQETLMQWKKHQPIKYPHKPKSHKKKTWTSRHHLTTEKQNNHRTQGASESLRPNSSAAFRTPKSDRWPARTAPRSCAHRGPSRGDRCV